MGCSQDRWTVQTINFASDFASDYCMMTKDEAHVKFGHLSEPMLRDLGDFEGNLSP